MSYPIRLYVNNKRNEFLKVEMIFDSVSMKFLCKFVPIVYPTLKQICKLNEISQKLFEEEDIYGVYGLKDSGIIENLLYIIKNSVLFGEDLYPTVTAKAADIWYKIARFQAFNNGNKRTALLTTMVFLMTNQLFFDFDLNNMENILYKISLKIASDEYKEKDVQKFILNHVKVDFDLMYNLLIAISKKI